MTGLAYAIIGTAIAMIFAGAGSAIGVGFAGQAASGVISESPNKFSKVLVMEVLPGTQGIYGFLIAILIMVAGGILGGTAPSVEVGMNLMFASLPIGLVGLISGIFQGKVSVAGINAIAKRGEISGKTILLTAMVETYAILALLVSILSIVPYLG